jgi:hypothetical protein
MLEIFRTSDEELPLDYELLPILTVAVLESGGLPLVSPPNIPHAVFTVNECVMVEQRRICNVFLDEVAYFLQKVKTWKGHPIVYEYVNKDLQSEHFVRDQLIPTLVSAFRANDGADDYSRLIRQRVAHSVLALATFPEFFRLSPDARDSLERLLNSEMKTVLAEPSLNDKYVSVRERALDHWNVSQHWPKPGCVFRVRRRMGDPMRRHSGAVGRVSERYVPVVYRNSSPVYGCEKMSVEDTAAEFHRMRDLAEVDTRIGCDSGRLRKFLSATKSARDELLDALF